MKHTLLVAMNWGKVILPLFFVFAAAVWFWWQKQKRTKDYVAETLRSHRLTNEKSQIYRDKIKYPNASSDDFRRENKLICELFKNPKIIGFEYRNHTIHLKEAKFPKRVPLNPNLKDMEFGRDHDNNVFTFADANAYVRASSGSGKSVLLYNATLGFFKSHVGTPFEILISDPHQTFSRLKSVEGIEVFEVDSISEKERFLERLKTVKEYQQEIDLSVHETLSEARKSGSAMDKKTFLVVVDELLESYSNANSKEEDYQVNQAIIAALKDIITSGRKFGQRLILVDQSSMNSQALIHPSLFQAHIYSYTDPEVADAKGGLPITHEVLKSPGTFYYTSKKAAPKFFRVPYIDKQNLLDLLKRSK